MNLALPPQPRPLVKVVPIWIFVILSLVKDFNCLWSVLTAIKSKSKSVFSAIRFTTLLPPPPTPIIFILTIAFFIPLVISLNKGTFLIEFILLIAYHNI